MNGKTGDQKTSISNQSNRNYLLGMHANKNSWPKEKKNLYGDKELHNWLNKMSQNGFLNYSDDGRHQYKNF